MRVNFNYLIKLLFAILIIAILLFINEALSSQHLDYHFSFVGYGGTFKYHDLKIIGIPIYWFMLLLGFIVTFIVSWYRKEKYKLSKYKAIIFPIIFLIIAFSGAKVLYIIETYFALNKIDIKLDGMSLFGAIYFVFLMVPLIALLTKNDILAMYDFFTPFGIILLACVRTGCFFNGCCGAVTIWNDNNPIILPVQLFEVVCDLVILELCFRIERKYPLNGYMYPFFMFSYSICRFLLEFLRNTPKDIFFLSHGQLFSIIAIIFSVFMFITIRKNVLFSFYKQR